MAIEAQLSLVQVFGREDNRRDAKLTCALCGKWFQEIHFYEGSGEPKFSGPLLWAFHYGECPAVEPHRPIDIRLAWDDGRKSETYRLHPSTRKLQRIE